MDGATVLAGDHHRQLGAGLDAGADRLWLLAQAAFGVQPGQAGIYAL
tara:strand:- start:8787 stop:8927 length:141 start_codon:yes stop_codon:yes gene_type:complete